MWASVAAKPKPAVATVTQPAPVPTSLKAPVPAAPPAESAAIPHDTAASSDITSSSAAAAVAKKLAHLVVDAGALIKGVRLDALADSFFSVEPVMAEVRDKQARELMGRLPFEITVRKPSPEALKAVSDFDVGAISGIVNQRLRAW